MDSSHIPFFQEFSYLYDMYAYLLLYYFFTFNLAMTSFTLSLSGTKSVLKAEYFPPIELNNGTYVCGLVDFQTFNSIPNVDQSNNQFHYIEDTFDSQLTSYEIAKSDQNFISVSNKIDDIDVDISILPSEKTITIPIGSYEIEDINNYLQKSLGKNVQFMLKINNNTLKSEILCNRKINFQKNNTIGTLLGFSERILDANILHESDTPVNILKVNAIRIECNITTGAYVNNKLVHTIHEFFPRVSSGYRIVEVPKNVIYLPVIVKSIHNLSVSIVDQDGNLIDFRGETITLRIHLKKVNE